MIWYASYLNSQLSDLLCSSLTFLFFLYIHYEYQIIHLNNANQDCPSLLLSKLESI